jgi:hypothetical protein
MEDTESSNAPLAKAENYRLKKRTARLFCFVFDGQNQKKSKLRRTMLFCECEHQALGTLGGAYKAACNAMVKVQGQVMKENMNVQRNG